MTDPEKNKQTVVAYYNLVINDKRPAEAVDKYGGSHYIQHDPQTPDGFEAFIQNLTDNLEQFPQMSLNIKRVVAEGDLVVTHSLLKTSPEDRGHCCGGLLPLGGRQDRRALGRLPARTGERSERPPHVLEVPATWRWRVVPPPHHHGARGLRPPEHTLWSGGVPLPLQPWPPRGSLAALAGRYEGDSFKANNPT